MNNFLKIGAVAVGIMCGFAAAAPSDAAQATATSDYCKMDYVAGMRNCGFASLEQCQATMSGRGGHCFQNLFAGASNSFASTVMGPIRTSKHSRH
jgi:Protein of unknown function (DUF3551)